MFLERKRRIEATIVALWQAPHDFEGTATFEKTFRNPERKISAQSSNIIEEFL
jgi:hypothetical protein